MKHTIYIFCCLVVVLCGCIGNEKKSTADIKFDKAKWSIKTDNDYPHREAMLNDLISNDQLKGRKRNVVIDLLGQPDRTDSGFLFYRISQKRVGFFPLSTKTLVIKLNKDSIVEWRKIHG